MECHKNSYILQRAVARMLFWGQQGVAPNIQKAVRHYERGAVQLEDPVSMYDYGIVLLQVRTLLASPEWLSFVSCSGSPSPSPICRDKELKKTSQKASSSWRKRWIRFQTALISP